MCLRTCTPRVGGRGTRWAQLVAVASDTSDKTLHECPSKTNGQAGGYVPVIGIKDAEEARDTVGEVVLRIEVDQEHFHQRVEPVHVSLLSEESAREREYEGERNV